MRKGAGFGLATTGFAVLALLATSPVKATETYASPSGYYVYAPVVSATPVTTRRSVRHPVRECSRTYAAPYDRHGRYEDTHHQENVFLPGLIGGLVGGFIGNQFGGGNGKKALTVAGALAGSAIARDAARSHHHSQRPGEICRTRYETETVDEIHAWDVTYEYAGQLFTKRVQERPDEQVRVQVSLSPADGY